MKIKILYTHERVKHPVLSTVILKTGVPLNILEASISPSRGELVVDVPASGDQLKAVIEALKAEGVEVRELGPTIEVDEEKCVLCGACVSPCPTGAITLTMERLEIDEQLCIRCKACVIACPFKALSMASTSWEA
ncbi:MAG: [Fe-S]-binding protein [Candidatus Hecatellales archaeon]|nr:MAG: [Fe-S]-binding protein [Candidatus Hecatellales archaeon]